MWVVSRRLWPKVAVILVAIEAIALEPACEPDLYASSIKGNEIYLLISVTSRCL